MSSEVFSHTLGALILAAGKGTRMHSELPKVLQTLLEEPMLRYVYDAVLPQCPQTTWTVIGHQAEQIIQSFSEHKGRFIIQEQQLGTGHALQVAWPVLRNAGLDYVLIVNGDTPLLPQAAVHDFAAATLEAKADIACITLTLDDPAAFGRVVRKNGEVSAIIEAKDYDEALYGPEPKEINAGIYMLRLAALEPFVFTLTNSNKNKEFYITDLVGMCAAAGLRVFGFSQGNSTELMGVNNPAELVRSEEYVRNAIVEKHLQSGVLIRSATTVRIGPDVTIEPGASITGPAELYGKCHISKGATIASHCRIENASVGANTVVHSFSHIHKAVIGNDCTVGPYARLRPGAVMEEHAHIGNFVEMKEARLGKGAKASHLTYIGDADIGAGANIGAGTITCNYDGVHKHLTYIGEGAFIGSNTALVAPVEIGSHAIIGAGSTITKSVPADSLGVTRAKQRILRKK